MNSMTKEKINPDDYITKREATLILGFKNSRSIAELVKKGYLKAYNIDSSKREVLKKSEVLDLPRKDPQPIETK
jgi:hypothetical protein